MFKISNKVLAIWKDPVWSKIISSGILVIIAFVWAKYSNYSLHDMWQAVLCFMSFTIPIYSILAIVGIIYIVYIGVKFFRKEYDIGSEPMGNFTFKELYLILQNQNLPIATLSMTFSNVEPPKENLLVLFQMYSSYMNVGVTLEYPRDDGGYLYGVLCPKLMSYGLVEKTEATNEKLDITEVKYQTSDLGRKFYSFTEKVTFLNPKRK